MDFCFEILAPIIMIICVIVLIILVGYLILDFSSRVKEAINNKNYEEIEVEEDEGAVEEYKVQKAIIVIGNENIEIEVDNYDIEDNIVEIQSIDGRVFITDTKNVLLMSD